MASFATLSRHGSGEIIHINLDFVVQIEQHENYTVLTFTKDMPSAITVKETPSQILELMRRGLKS